MNEEKIVFMGTPEFARNILQELIDEKRNVVAVVCQPDKKVGRKQIITFPPVKQLAVENNIPVIQPYKIKDEYAEVLSYEPDLIITCAFGQFIPKAVLKAPRLGCINIHGSLLPKLRGGAPIQHAIIDGYKETGITIMEMISRMDAGDMIAQRSCIIEDSDTYGSLHDKLNKIAVELLRDTLPSILEGNYQKISQDENEVTFGYNIAKEEEKIDFSRSYRQVYDQIRGLIPEPCAYFTVNGKKVKVWKAEMSELTSEEETGMMHYYGNDLGITVENKVILIKELQMEGKQKMSCRDFKNGAGRNWDGLKAE